MKLVIAHLTDIHIRYDSDLVLRRGAQIGSAVLAACGTATSCLIVLSGDIAYSGSAEEYYLALQLVSDIIDAIKAEGKEVHVVTVPGNHDCSLVPGDPIREAVIESIRKDHRQADSLDVQELCSKVQENYREFDEQVATLQRPARFSQSSSMVREVEVGSVLLRLVNSAWMSSMREGPGTLVFPASAISDIGQKFTITCLHHPPQWYTPGTRRELWRTLSQSSDLIITGHEHESGQTHVNARSDSASYTHFEGGVLQADGRSQESSFVVYVVSETERTYQAYRYDWKGKDGAYKFRVSESDGSARPRIEPLPLNRIRHLKSFEFNDEHVAFLDSLTMNITHPHVGNLRLRDVFVYPDLVGTSDANSGNASTLDDSTIRGEKVLDFVLRTPRVLLTGEKYSGRTALAKTLCVDLQERGYVPVYLRLDRQLRNAAAWVEAIEKSFGAQYDSSLLQRFQQLSTASRVVIVDDVDQCCGAADVFASQLEEIGGYAGHVIISADMAALGMKALFKIAQEGMPHYQIRQFGYRQREQLVKKWLLLGGGERDGQALVRKFHESTRTLNGIVGKGFVPSYPFFVLTILHAAESVVQLETKTSAQGYYFEQLIRAELQRGRQDHAKLDVVLGVLSYLGYCYFAGERTEMTDGELRASIQAYEHEYALSLDYGQLLSHLVERRMLTRRADKYAFAYDYVYYFFVARYLSRNIERDEIREHVSELCRISRHRKSGDILLFLAHFSNDSFVVTQMLKGADEAYAECSRIDLRNDPRIVGELSDVAGDDVYEEGGDAMEARHQVAEANDRQAERHGVVGREAEPDTEIEAIRRLIAALRNMEVVGQVLKNSPGHLSADKKKELALAAYGVGARIWRWFLGYLVEDRRALVDEMVAYLKTEQPGIGRDELKEEVAGRLNSLVRLVSFSMVKRIALSIGAPELEQTYRSLVAELKGADAAKLVFSSIVLDCFSGSAEGEMAAAYGDLKDVPLSVWILRQLVLEHLHLFQLEPAEKQRLCAAVEMRYQSGLGSGQRTKRLPK